MEINLDDKKKVVNDNLFGVNWVSSMNNLFSWVGLQWAIRFSFKKFYTAALSGLDWDTWHLIQLKETSKSIHDHNRDTHLWVSKWFALVLITHL